MTELVSWAALIASLVTLYIAWKKLKPETRGIDAQTIERYQNMLDEASIREGKYIARIEDLKTKVDALEVRQDETETKVRDAEARANKFEDWAKRLVAQIESWNEIPVPFEPKPRNPTRPRTA